MLLNVTNNSDNSFYPEIHLFDLFNQNTNKMSQENGYNETLKPSHLTKMVTILAAPKRMISSLPPPTSN